MKMILPALLLFVIVSPLWAAKEALLIANADYSHFGKLPNPISDARQLANVLQQIGFNVSLVENASREGMLDALGSFEERLKASQGIAFFHYGGHGVQVDGKNFLIPADADIPDEKRVATRAVDVDEVMGALDASGSSANVVVLDACRDNPLPATSTRSATRGLSVVAQKPKNSIIIYAAEAGSKAQDGLFTPTLAKALAAPGRAISDVMTDVRREVYEKSGGTQTPGEYNQLFEKVFLGSTSRQEIGIINEPPKVQPEGAGQTGVALMSNAEDGPVEGSATLIEATMFSAKSGGKIVGNIKAPAGAQVKISEVSRDRALVQFGIAEQKWIEQTKLKNVKLAEPSFSEAARQNPTALSAPRTAPPVAGKASSEASAILEGAQKHETVVVGPGKHQLRGQYSVSNGQKLVIEAGAQITAERDAGISVSGGSLVIEGRPDATVIFNGPTATVGSWSGLKFNAASSVDIANARISGADIGMTFTSCQKAYVTSTSLTKCNVGILLQNWSKISIEDCLIADNRGSGIRDNLSEPIIIRTTIADNREWGYFCEYYGSPRFDSCIIANNKLGGIQGTIYDSYSEARNCVIQSNGKLDVEHRGTKDWDYSGCWWGEENTRRLISSGENANLKTIQDQLDDAKVGRVRIEGFLKVKPENVGTTLAATR